MQSKLQKAHADGARDGAAGVGPVAPRDPALKAAYMQSYRDALVAREGVPERRRNPRKHCRGAAKRARCSKRRIRRRKTNPRRPLLVLYATKGRTRLKYLGSNKFGAKGRAMLFHSSALAKWAARILRAAYPQALRGWVLKAE
jgi:hypothetical protein